jgi:hypothetical protein
MPLLEPRFVHECLTAFDLDELQKSARSLLRRLQVVVGYGYVTHFSKWLRMGLAINVKMNPGHLQRFTKSFIVHGPFMAGCSQEVNHHGRLNERSAPKWKR